MADLASIHFELDALAWYSHLESDVQADWSKLQVALVDHWSAPDSLIDRRKIMPVAAAARNSDDWIIQTFVSGSSAPLYVTWDAPNGRCGLANNMGSALRLRIDRKATSTTLFGCCVDGQSNRLLAIRWPGANPFVGQGSSEYSFLTTINKDLDTPYQIYGPGLLKLAVGKVSSLGEVVFLWNHDDQDIALTAFTSGSMIFLSCDPTAYSAKFKKEQKISLFIRKCD